MADSLLENYNPLYDVHLRQYFALPHMQKHLRKMGLLDENARGNEVYERHHAMMDVMLKNRETQLFKMAELRRKLDAAEKVETCRRIRAGLSPESYRKPAKPSRSLSRGRRSSGSGRTRRFSNSYDDKQIIQKMEEDFAEPNDSNPRDAYKRLSANTKKFNYLHKMDDPSLISYTNSLKKQLDRLERFREVTFGVHSVARTQPVAHTSWFFRRRSLPSLTASAPANVLHEPLRSINNMRGRKHSPQTGKLGQSYDSRTSCPPTMRKRRDSNSRLPPISSKTKPTKSPQKAGPKSAPAARLPPAKPSTRGRSTTRKETTTTVTRTVPKQDNVPPISGGIVLVGGGAAAAAAAAAAAVKVASPTPKEEETPAPEPVQQSPEPIQEPVPDEQPSANKPEVHEPEPQAEVAVIGDLDREPSPQQEVAPEPVREPSPEQEVVSESAREPTPEQEQVPETVRKPSPEQEDVSEPVEEAAPVVVDSTEKENTTPEPVVVESAEAMSDRVSVASSRHVEEETSEHQAVSPEVLHHEEVVEPASEPVREPSPEVDQEQIIDHITETATQQEDEPEQLQEQEVSHEEPTELHQSTPSPRAEFEVQAEQPVSPEPVQAASPVPTEQEAPDVEEDLSQHPSTPVLTETHSPVEEAVSPQEDVSGEEAFEKVIVTDVQTQPEEEVHSQPEEPSQPSPRSEPADVEPPMELHQTTMLETESAESSHEVTSPSQVEDEHASATIVDHFPGENHEYTEYDNQGYRSDKESEAETRSVQSAVVSEAPRQMSVSDDSEPEYAEEDKISNAESQPQQEDVGRLSEVAHDDLIDINTHSVESPHGEHNSPKEEEQFERYEQSQDVVNLGEEQEVDSDEAQFGGAEVAAMQEEGNEEHPADEAVVPDQDIAEPYVETVVEPEVTIHDEDEEVQFEVEDEQIAESQVVPSDEPMQSEEEHNTLGNAEMMQSVYQEQSQDDGMEHGYGHEESVVEHGNLSEQEVHEVEPMGAVESTHNDLVLEHGSEHQQEHFETSHQESYPPSPREQEHEVTHSPVDEHHESVIHSETQQHDNHTEMEKEHKDQEHFDNDNDVVSQVRLEITPPDQKVDNEEDVPEFASEAEKRMEDDSMSTDSMIIHEDHTEDSTEAPSDMMSQSVYESRMSPSEYETKYDDELAHETELTTPKSQASEDLEADDESTHHPIVTETEWTEGNKTIHETSVHNEHTDNNGQDFYTETKITTTNTTEHVGSDGDVTNNNEDTKSTTSHEELHTGSNGNVQSGLVLDDLHNDQNVSSI